MKPKRSNNWFKGNSMVTVHLLTKNNCETIQKALDSIKWADQILVADLGSKDETIQICEAAGAKVFRLDRPRNEARNELIAKTSGITLCLEPWEFFAKGQLNKVSKLTNAMVIQQTTITKEIRAWKSSPTFVNPVYETIEGDGAESDILIYSTGRSDHEDLLFGINKWKELCPMATAPYYYEACTLLAIGKWKEFLNISEYYMFLDRSSSVSVAMNHYYFAIVQLMKLHKVTTAIQNITICLSINPLMAEFWCLAGDVHYHLTKKFHIAKELYENAIILGEKRLKNDKWPMDISKYKSYPLKMIESCDKIISSKSLYVS